jgi:hypothetical protein
MRPQTDQEEEDEEELEGVDEKRVLTTSAEERDFREEAIWIDSHKNKLKSFFQDAKEQKQIIEDSERPITLARKALSYIEAIPDDSERLQEAAVDRILGQIIARTNKLRKLIQKGKNRKQKR